MVASSSSGDFHLYECNAMDDEMRLRANRVSWVIGAAKKVYVCECWPKKDGIPNIKGFGKTQWGSGLANHSDLILN